MHISDSTQSPDVREWAGIEPLPMRKFTSLRAEVAAQAKLTFDGLLQCRTTSPILLSSFENAPSHDRSLPKLESAFGVNQSNSAHGALPQPRRAALKGLTLVGYKHW